MNAPLRALSILAGLVLAAGGGYWFGRARPVAPAPAAAPAPVADVARLRTENERLLAENARLGRAQKESAVPTNATAGATRSDARVEALKVLAEMQRTKAGMIRVTLLERNTKLSDGFAQLFEVTPAERESLQQTLDDARAQTTKLAMTNATLKVEGDALVATIPPFEGGADIYDTVMDAFARTLGPARNQAFVALQADQLSSALSGFGAERRTVTIHRENRPNGDAVLSIHDQRKGPSGSGSTGTSMPMLNMNRVLEQYPWLEPHVDTIKALPPRTPPVKIPPPR
jgi:hypothetical protein